MLMLQLTLTVSPFNTARSPPVNKPELTSTPEVFMTALEAPAPPTRNEPLMVPPPVMEKLNAALSALAPADAAAQTQVGRLPD